MDIYVTAAADPLSCYTSGPSWAYISGGAAATINGVMDVDTCPYTGSG
jgi:hypothetical protein